MAMNGFNNPGMGMGMGDGMLGGAPGGRFGMDELQQSAGMGTAAVGTAGMGASGMAAAGMAPPGMGVAGMAGMGGYSGAGAMGAAGMGGFAGTGAVGNSSMLSQPGRDDELLISLLRERNQLQGVPGVAGGVPGAAPPAGVPGVVPNLYGSSAAGMPATQAGLLGNLNLNPGAAAPYDLSTRFPQEQAPGLGFPPYLMDARAPEVMMRDFPNPNNAGTGNLLYDQQRAGLSGSPAATPGFAFPGFDPSGRDQQIPAPPQTAAPDQTQPPPAREEEEEEEEEAVDDDLQGRDDVKVPPVAMAAPTTFHATKPPPDKKIPPKASKKRQLKDGPRRPLSAYNLFFSDERERILKEREDESEGPDGKKGAGKIQVQEMAKIIGERWRVLPDEWRKYYQELADEDMKRHREAKRRAPKDPSVPKRPPTSFLLFSNKRRKALKRQYPDATNSDLSKMLSKTWREAPPQIRQKYMDEATELSKIYKADMVVWRRKAGERKSENEDAFEPSPSGNPKSLLGKKGEEEDEDDLSDIGDSSLPLGMNLDGRPPFLMDNNEIDEMGDSDRPSKPNLPSKPPGKKRKTKDPSAPKRPLSAFLAFSNTRRKALKQQYPDATNADLSKMLSKMWRESPGPFRQKFIDEAAELSEAYKSEMAEWRMKTGAP